MGKRLIQRGAESAHSSCCCVEQPNSGPKQGTCEGFRAYGPFIKADGSKLTEGNTRNPWLGEESCDT